MLCKDELPTPLQPTLGTISGMVVQETNKNEVALRKDGKRWVQLWLSGATRDV